MINVRGMFTDCGRTLFQKVLAGEARLEITRAVAGSGHTGQTAVALENIQQALPLSTPRVDSLTVTRPVTLVAQQAESTYVLREVGIYAQDPQQGEILYRIYQLGTPLTVDPTLPESIRFYLKESLSEIKEAPVEYRWNGVLTEQDLEDMKNAPNGVAGLNEERAVAMEQLPFVFSTEDLVAGESELDSGTLYFVYE